MGAPEVPVPALATPVAPVTQEYASKPLGKRKTTEKESSTNTETNQFTKTIGNTKVEIVKDQIAVQKDVDVIVNFTDVCSIFPPLVTLTGV